MRASSSKEARPDILKGDLLTKAVLGPCRVRSETDHPCFRPAVVEIGGIPFCEQCAREQEAYFEIGELTQPLANDRTEQARDFHPGETPFGPLLKALGRMRRGLTAHTGEVEPERAKATVGSLK
jgi:hypothetical protein